MIKKIENGQIIIKGKNPEGDLELEYADSVGTKKPATIWNMVSHSASEHGSTFIKNILPGRKFTYPKSLYCIYCRGQAHGRIGYAQSAERCGAEEA